jgi:uncharacterized protein
MSLKQIADGEIISRIRFENPWWQSPHSIDATKREMGLRKYFDLFYPLFVQRDPRRAVILMGPRRVGKTVLMHQAVQRHIDDGTTPISICYLDLQTPTYAGLNLERLLNLARAASGADPTGTFCMLYDEIQYLKDWEVQLKNAVDSFPRVKFIASGSAAAALRIKSVESGAGRFTDFLLPPVTFYEFLILVKVDPESFVQVTNQVVDGKATSFVNWNNIEEFNRHFLNYLNYGGYPEAALSPAVQSDPGRFIRSDIVDKVITRDLPSLYGIHDVSELNRLFSTLAYNTGQEVSLEGLSQNSGVVKQTINRYIEYLEAAFLIKRLHRIDDCAKRFKRANHFKIYLTNPCMRGAFFAPIEPDSEHIGSLVETAIFSQWLHSNREFHYARWKDGEVDFIELDPLMFRPQMAVEAKWSDRSTHDETNSFRSFLRKHPKCLAIQTSRTSGEDEVFDGRKIMRIPAAVYCYFIGLKMLEQKKSGMSQLATGRPA